MAKYTEYLGVKLSPQYKKLLEKSGYKGRHAVEYFISHVTSDKHRLKVEKFFLEKKFEEKKIELISLEKAIEEINIKLGVTNKKTNYNEKVKNSLKVIKDNYNFTKTRHPSKSLNIEDFIFNNDPMINAQADLCGLSIETFKKAVIEYVEG